MLAIKNGQRLAADEQPPSRKSDPAELVWDQINAWVWVSVCGRFKIERFITGEHEWRGTGFNWPERYRVLKHNPEWYFEHPSEPTLAAAQQACEKLIPRGTSSHV